MMKQALHRLGEVFRRPENTYIALGLLFGVLFLVTTPAFQAPDEGDHFFKAYALSELKFLPTISDNACVLELPASLVRTIMPYTGTCWTPEAKIPPGRVRWLMQMPLSPDQTRPCITGNPANYPPVAHLPASIAVGVSRKLGKPAIVLSYWGRLATLLVAVGLIYLAVRICPMHKWVLSLLGLMPMTVFITSSMSADALAIATAFLLFAYVMRLATDELPLTTKRLVIVSLLAALVTLCKLLYFPLALLLACVPTKKFKTPTRKLLVLASLCFLTVGIFVIWSSLVSKRVEIINLSLGRQVDVNTQVQFILGHPIRYMVLVVKTVVADAALYYNSFIGILGWSDTLLPTWVVISFGLALLITAISDSNPRVKVSILQRLWALALSGGICMLLMTMQFVIWTIPGNQVVEGFRGRYLIPLSPMVFLCLYNHHPIGQKLRRYLPIVLPLFAATILAATLHTVHKRYYVPENDTFSLGLAAHDNTHIQGGITRRGQLRQSFVSPWADLNGVEVLLCTFGVENLETPYRLELYQQGITSPIRQAELDRDSVKDWQWHRFNFDPIPDSKNKRYWFTLVPITEEVRTPITIQLARKGIYPEGRTWINGDETTRDIAFKMLFVPRARW